LLLVNVFIGEDYLHFWHQKTLGSLADAKLNLSLEHWINDGLMVIFFLLVGLEIERELYIGELSDAKTALVPIFAAVGGMIFPALIHFRLNSGADTQNGFGIPMATDIAFALGILSLVGKRIPFALKVFLTALAIIDDLGAIIIIAIFYTKDLDFLYLIGALVVFGLLIVLNRLKIYKIAWYIIGGLIMWYCFLRSGVHTTIAGVLLAFAIPFGDGGERSPSYKLQHWLHKPVAFFILPLFALANTGILFEGRFKEVVANRNSLGIIAGLVLGKPLGILLTLLVAVRLKLVKLPDNIKWKHIAGAGMLAGIGFTMSIFITLLAFDDAALVADSKIAVLLASLVSGVVGFMFLKYAVKDDKIEQVL
jgi:NhaA family Na+:H+ antiporter